MYKFTVGEEVCVPASAYYSKLINKIGIVRRIVDTGVDVYFAVEFPGFSGGHDCNNACFGMSGWYLLEEDLESVTPFEGNV